MKRYLIILTVLLTCGTSSAANKSQIFDPLLVSQRAGGVTLAAGKAYFYVPGSTTLKPIWMDRNSTIPAPNPLTLDSDGAARVYGDGLYDISITNSTGVQKFFWEDVKIQDVARELVYFDTLSDAVTAIGTSKVTLIVASDTTTNSLTIPSNIELQVTNGSVITVNSGQTLTIKKFSAGNIKTFAGTGSVVFGVNAVKEVIPQWWGAVGDGIATSEDTAINKAATCASVSNLPLYIPAGNYKTSAPIIINSSVYGSPRGNPYINPIEGTTIKPQGAFPAFDIGVIIGGVVEHLRVDYSDIIGGATSINSSCIAFRLLYYSTAANQQISNTVFRNITTYYAYSGIKWADSQSGGTGVPQGQLYSVTFDHVNINFSKDWGFYLSSTDSSLNIYLSNVTIDAPNHAGNDPVVGNSWLDSKGYYLYNMTMVTLKSCLASSINNKVDGEVLSALSIHKLILENFQHEGTIITSPGIDRGPMSFATCEDVQLSIINQSMTVNKGGTNPSAVCVFSVTCKNIIVLSMMDFSNTVTSGVRKWFYFPGGLQNAEQGINILDFNVKRSDCILGVMDTTLQYGQILFADKASALGQIPTDITSYKQLAAYQVNVPAATTTKILDITAFGLSPQPISGLFIVSGIQTSDGDKGFYDVISIGGVGSSGTQGLTVINSSAIAGYAVARTYTVTATELRLSVPTEGALVNITGIAQTGITIPE